MKLVAGIDGGQTSTVALLADERGMVIGRGIAGPCDDVGEPADSRRLAETLETALAEAALAGGIPKDAEIDALVAGVSGFEGAIHGVAPQLPARRVRYVHDAPVAHAGAFALGSGIVVIAGTGSVAFGLDGAGRSVTVGGWGFLFGDEGSAFGIARDALTRAMQAEDEGGTSVLGEAARRRFEAPTLRTLVRSFYTGGIPRPGVAGFATDVLGAAWSGDTDAKEVVADAASALARLASISAGSPDFHRPGRRPGGRTVCGCGVLGGRRGSSSLGDPVGGAGRAPVRSRRGRVAPGL